MALGGFLCEKWYLPKVKWRMFGCFLEVIYSGSREYINLCSFFREEYKSKNIEDIKFLDKRVAYLIQANGNLKTSEPLDIRDSGDLLDYVLG